MATFQEFTEFVASDLTADGDSQFTLPESAYYSSPFGKRLAVLLKSFSVQTNSFFTIKEAITIGAGDQTFDLSDSSNCSKSFHSVSKVWLNGEPITKLDSVMALMAIVNPDDGPALPSAWAQLDEKRILFNSDPTGSIANSYVAGFYRHPNITSDETLVDFPEDEWPMLSQVVGISLRLNVAADEIGLSRIAQMNDQVYRYIAEKKQRSFRFLHGTVK
jgi:hypothetical protein